MERCGKLVHKLHIGSGPQGGAGPAGVYRVRLPETLPAAFPAVVCVRCVVILKGERSYGRDYCEY